MRRIAVTTLSLAALAAACFGQQWEFGGAAGAGFLSNVNVSSPVGSATAGFQSGGAFGGFVGENLYPHWAGEVHYMYLQSDLHISSGGTNATFNGNAQVLHYDMLYHTNRKGSKMQAFAAVGGGVKIFSGTVVAAAWAPVVDASPPPVKPMTRNEPTRHVMTIRRRKNSPSELTN